MKVKNIFGEFSGSIGDMTFSKNKSGFYVKNRAKPTNPRTEAQVQARQNLALSAGAWGALSPEQKNKWSEYGRTLFTGLNGTTNVTGLAAFSAANTIAKNSALLSATPPDGTQEPIVINPDNVPMARPSPIFTTQANPGFTIGLGSITLRANGIGTANMAFSDNVAFVAEGFSNLSTGSSGFAVYASQPYNYEGGYSGKLLQTLLGNTGMLSDITFSGQLFALTFSTSAKVGNIGQFVLVSLVAFDEYGQTIILHSRETDIKAVD